MAKKRKCKYGRRIKGKCPRKPYKSKRAPRKMPGKVRWVSYHGVRTKMRMPDAHTVRSRWKSAGAGSQKCDNKTIRNAINTVSGGVNGGRGCAHAAKGVAVLKRCDFARGVGRRGGVSTGNFMSATRLLSEYKKECKR